MTTPQRSLEEVLLDCVAAFHEAGADLHAMLSETAKGSKMHNAIQSYLDKLESEKRPEPTDEEYRSAAEFYVRFLVWTENYICDQLRSEFEEKRDTFESRWLDALKNAASVVQAETQWTLFSERDKTRLRKLVLHHGYHDGDTITSFEEWQDSIESK